MVQNNGTLSDGVDFSRSSVSRYIQLSTLFRRKIDTGEWPVDCQIPTIEELSDKFGVAKATIRQALDLLEQDGLVSRYRAKGTFVNNRPVVPTWCEVETNWDGLLVNRDGVSIEVLREQDNIALPRIEYPIGQPSDSYRALKRLHSREGSPYLIADVYLDEKLVPRLDPSAFSEMTAMRLISSIPRTKIVDARQIMSVGIADLETANFLNIALNSPVFLVDRFVVDTRGRLALVSKGIYRGDIIKLDFKLR